MTSAEKELTLAVAFENSNIMLFSVICNILEFLAPTLEPGMFIVFTSRKAGQHVLLVQGGGPGTFSFLETSVHVKPLENL